MVQGSVIQLYCTANSTSVTFSWTKDGNPVVINVPHLRQRTTNESNSLATSVLTIDNFESSDDGVYRCTVTNSETMASGSNVTLTGMISCMHMHDSILTNCPAFRETVPLFGPKFATVSFFSICPTFFLLVFGHKFVTRLDHFS